MVCEVRVDHQDFKARAQRWRVRARTLRDIAACVRNARAEGTLLRQADAWETMAAQAETMGAEIMGAETMGQMSQMGAAETPPEDGGQG
jgi:hypothetical protein